MATGYILYNPAAGNGQTKEDLSLLDLVMDVELIHVDITNLEDYSAFINKLNPDDLLIIAGGDGTLCRFVNDTEGLDFPCEILYYPTGSGNDFAHDLGKHKNDNPFPITKYLQNLPTVEVRGKKYRFLNGVGYGIDGYCCEIGDELRKIPGKKINYTAIAVKGLLFDYVPTNAVVTVDGVRHEYTKVWLAPTMHGRCYGGGMIPTPQQNRCSEDGMLSIMVFHGSGKLRTLMIFPSIFKGKHVSHKKMVDILTGHEITVEFSNPRPLQIDGETILNVHSYTAKSGAKVKTPV